jgi:copper amine oxidase-like protein
MKKKLSLLLVLALVISLVPMSVFAATDNGVNKVVKAKKDAKLTTGAPELRIENDDNHMEADETIILELTNAEWLANDDDFFGKSTLEETVANYVYDKGGVTEAEFNSFEVDRKTATKLEIKFAAKDVASIATDVFTIPMYAKLQGEGTAKVHVSSKTGTLTSESIEFAVGTEGDVVVELDDTIAFSGKEEIPTITISEATSGTVDVDELKDEYVSVKVDSDFDILLENGAVKAYVAGDFLADKKVFLNDTNTVVDENEVKIYFKGANKDLDMNDFPKTVTAPIELSTTESVARDFDIVNLIINPDSKADEGDVDLTVKSSIDEVKTINFDLGTFAEYDVTVEADGDALEIFSGRYEGFNTTDEEHELQKLIIKEEVVDAINNDRSVVVEFPTWVKILNVTGDMTEVNNPKIDENEYEFEPKDDGDKVDLELTFYVSVEAGKAGDIEANIYGRAFDKEEHKVVLGKAIAPVAVEAEVAKLKAGVRKQEVGKITLTESDEDAFMEDGWVILELSDDDMEWDDEPTIEVVEGDLEIDEDSIEVDYNGLGDHVLAFKIKEESSEASVIEITDGKVKLDRSIAEGAIEIEVKGSALLANYSDVKAKKDDEGMFGEDTYATVEVANIITPADADTTVAEAAKFVIGNAEYQVGEEVKTADVAPYIKDGRTMLSLRYVAEAMGVASDNIMWDQATRTVTIFKGDRVAQVTIGSNKLMVGGAAVTMDTVAEIKDGRTCLPVSFVAKALGADVEWDGATRTVTIK